MRLVGAIILFLVSFSAYCLPVADTQGAVTAVRVVHSGVNGGKASFQIFFDKPTRDRWGCLASDGYILVREGGVGVTPESFKMIFSVALAAQTSGRILAVDSSGTNPCINVNTAWMSD